MVDPVLFLLTLFFAFVFGELYLLIVTVCYSNSRSLTLSQFFLLVQLSKVFDEGNGHSTGMVGVDMLSRGIGCAIGLVSTMKRLDLAHKQQTKKTRKHKPETRYVFLAHD